MKGYIKCGRRLEIKAHLALHFKIITALKLEVSKGKQPFSLLCSDQGFAW